MRYVCLLLSKPSIIFKFFKSGAGFTLIELMVSISISVLISTIFLVDYRSTSKQSELNMTAQKLVSDIRLAQNYSLGSTEYGENIPLGGWGVHFDRISSPGNYIIFADNNGNKHYDSGESDSNKGGQVISLPAGVSINGINAVSPSEEVSAVNYIDITFLPPDPTTNILDSSDNPYNSVGIILLGEDDSSTRTIEVNFFGLIEGKE